MGACNRLFGRKLIGLDLFPTVWSNEVRKCDTFVELNRCFFVLLWCGDRVRSAVRSAVGIHVHGNRYRSIPCTRVPWSGRVIFRARNIMVLLPCTGLLYVLEGLQREQVVISQAIAFSWFARRSCGYSMIMSHLRHSTAGWHQQEQLQSCSHDYSKAHLLAPEPCSPTTARHQDLLSLILVRNLAHSATA